MKIAISMIALNEEDHIERSIASCSFADVICLIDGGSVDETVAKAKAVANKMKTKIVVKQEQFPNDFAKQRQRALAIVPEDIDWWLRIDADEEYPELFRENIRSLLEGMPEQYLCARIKQYNLIDPDGIYSAARGGWETWPRIFRNLKNGKDSAWHWIGQVHEYCRLMGKQGLSDPVAGDLNLPVIHFGWLSDERREDREKLYLSMQGSGFEKGSLTQREHEAKILPFLAWETE